MEGLLYMNGGLDQFPVTTSFHGSRRGAERL